MLSRSDWTEAALEALVRDGLPGVAIEPLARSLGATKGSFYWHFANQGDLITATLTLWEQRETTDVIAAIAAIPDPLSRLTALGRGAVAGAARGNGNTAVLAAAADPRVGPVLERVTRTRLAFLARLYRELGLADDEAVDYARLAYALYLGIGELRRADRRPDLTGPALERWLDLALQAALPAEHTRSGPSAAPGAG